MGRSNAWKAHIAQEMYRSRHPAAAAFFQAVVEELRSDVPTRREFSDEREIFSHALNTLLNVIGALHLSGWLDPDGTSRGSLNDVVRTKKGDTRESIAWLRRRPVWVSAFRQHSPLLADDGMFGPAVRDLLALVDERPGSPELDDLTPGARTHGQTSDWRKSLREMDAPPSFPAWVETCVAEISGDPRASGSFEDESEIVSFLVHTLSLSGLIFVAKPKMGRAEGNRMAADLADRCLFLFHHPEWLETMNRNSDMLTGWYSDSLAAMVDAIENS